MYAADQACTVTVVPPGRNLRGTASLGLRPQQETRTRPGSRPPQTLPPPEPETGRTLRSYASETDFGRVMFNLLLPAGTYNDGIGYALRPLVRGRACHGELSYDRTAQEGSALTKRRRLAQEASHLRNYRTLPVLRWNMMLDSQDRPSWSLFGLLVLFGADALVVVVLELWHDPQRSHQPHHSGRHAIQVSARPGGRCFPLFGIL